MLLVKGTPAIVAGLAHVPRRGCAGGGGGEGVVAGCRDTSRTTLGNCRAPLQRDTAKWYVLPATTGTPVTRKWAPPAPQPWSPEALHDQGACPSADSKMATTESPCGLLQPLTVSAPDASATQL